LKKVKNRAKKKGKENNYHYVKNYKLVLGVRIEPLLDTAHQAG
jgi:hypothetical protein